MKTSEGRGRRVGSLVTAGALLASASTALVGCGGAKRPPDLPPPVYEQPELPPWEPEVAADPLDDAHLEGEWVDEPPPGEGTSPGADPGGAEPVEPSPAGAERERGSDGGAAEDGAAPPTEKAPGAPPAPQLPGPQAPAPASPR